MVATSVTGSAAILNGTVNPLGANGWYQFEWGTDPTLTTNASFSCDNYYTMCPKWTANSLTQALNYSIGTLPSVTTYYFRIIGYDSDNNAWHYGAILSFTTQ
jgi:hypothetical protein